MNRCTSLHHGYTPRRRMMPCLIVALILVVAAVLVQPSAAHLGPPTNLTVSGLSSGAYMAVQFHVAYSSEVDGAGIVAGGPYYSSQGNVITALSSMEDPSIINLSLISTQISAAAAVMSIDSPTNLARSNAWVFAGKLDVTVNPGVGRLLADQYRSYGVNVTTVFDVPAAHAFPTDNWGNPCNYTGPIYINNCGLDAAKEILLNVYPQLRNTWKPPVTPNLDNLIPINQGAYVPSSWKLFTLESLGLQPVAYTYYPTNCQRRRPWNSCPVHVAFHGCRQTLDHIGTDFIVHSGYLRWAEANDIIVVFPQSRMNTLNPKGCFDWWGFTGTAFATKLGAQLGTSYNMAIAVRDFNSFVRANASEVEGILRRHYERRKASPLATAYGAGLASSSALSSSDKTTSASQVPVSTPNVFPLA